MSKELPGLRLQARATGSVDHKGGIAWRGSQVGLSRRPALEGQK